MSSFLSFYLSLSLTLFLSACLRLCFGAYRHVAVELPAPGRLLSHIISLEIVYALGLLQTRTPLAVNVSVLR